MEIFDTAVVGGGLAGLGVATLLRERGKNVVLFEKEDQPGGKVRSVREDGFVVELGPLGWLDREPVVSDLVAGLGLKPLIAKDVQKDRSLFKDGGLIALPSDGPSFLMSKVLPFHAKMRLAGELFIPARRHGEESVESFATRRFGKHVANTLFGAMVSGIYGGDPQKLSVHAAFPLMAGWEFESGSCMRGALKHMRKKRRDIKQGRLKKTSGTLCSLAGGLGDFTDAAAQNLGANYRGGQALEAVTREGDFWELHQAGAVVARAHHLVLATPARESARLLGAVGKELAQVAATIPGNNLCVVTGAWRRDQVQHELQSFGFIALRNHGFRPLGVQYASSIFPDQSPSDMVQLRVLIGGSFDPDVADLSDQELQAACFDPLHKLLGVQGDPERVWMRRVAGGIPQYTVGHLSRVAAFDAMEEKMPGLFFAGDSLHGVGVNAVLKRALVVADRLCASR